MSTSSTSVRNRGAWTPKRQAYLERVHYVLNDLAEYWPLTLRQVYYQLVAAIVIENNAGEYKKLSEALSHARLDGLVPWEALEDRSRSTLEAGGWTDAAEYLDASLRAFLARYRRDLLQSQDVAIEVWVEKDALSRVCLRAAEPFCVPVVVAKGFSSVSYVHECRKRVQHHAAAGKQTVILYFGDLDPSGWEMLPSMMLTLQHEMGLGHQVRAVRCALTPDQVADYNLPRSLDALKPTDSRAKKYMQQFGDLAVELDALPPATLEGLVRDAIEAELDLSVFEDELAEQTHELERLAHVRRRVQAFVGRPT